MKKSVFFAMACFAMCLASCNSFESEKIELTSDLFSVTSLGEKGDTLCGVFKADGSQLIAPQPGVKFVMDDYQQVIIAEPKAGTDYFYYTLAGLPITDGPIRDFEVPNAGYGKIVFIGTKPDGQTVIYFPENSTIILTKGLFIDDRSAMIGYQTSDGFVLRSLAQAPSDPYTIKEKNAYFVTCDGKDSKVVVPAKRTATVYSLTGAKEKTIPINVWKKAFKKAQDVSKIGDITWCRVVKPL